MAMIEEWSMERTGCKEKNNEGNIPRNNHRSGIKEQSWMWIENWVQAECAKDKECFIGLRGSNGCTRHVSCYTGSGRGNEGRMVST